MVGPCMIAQRDSGFRRPSRACSRAASFGETGPRWSAACSIATSRARLNWCCTAQGGAHRTRTAWWVRPCAGDFSADVFYGMPDCWSASSLHSEARSDTLGRALGAFLSLRGEGGLFDSPGIHSDACRAFDVVCRLGVTWQVWCAAQTVAVPMEAGGLPFQCWVRGSSLSASACMQ